MSFVSLPTPHALYLTPEAILKVFRSHPDYADTDESLIEFWLDWCTSVLECLKDRLDNIATYAEIVAVKLDVFERVMTKDWCFMAYVPNLEAYHQLDEERVEEIKRSYQIVRERIDFYTATLAEQGPVESDLQHTLTKYWDEFPDDVGTELLTDVFRGEYTVGELIALCPWMLLK